MKKLGFIIVAASLSFAAPVFACPHHEEAPKTAEKPKDDKGQDKEKAPAPVQPKEMAPETAKAKEQPKKDEPKKPEKVSQK